MKGVYLLFLFGSCAFALEQSDRAAIREVIQNYTEAWNAFGGKGFADGFTENADFVNIHGMKFSGKEEIEVRHVKIIETFFKGSKLEILDTQLREAQPGLVIASVRWRLKGYRTPDSDWNKPGEIRDGIFTQIFIKSDEKWKITASQNTLIAGPPPTIAKEIFVETNQAKLFCRIMGEGKPLIVIHGGPGLSQDYLLPSLNQLAKHNTVVFYDQRNSGRSEGGGEEKWLELNTFVDDLEAIRKQLGFEKVALLGHSWGGFLAMAYATAHPGSVDRLILANSLPATSQDLNLMMQEWGRRMGPYIEEFQAVHDSKEYTAGDPETVARAYKILFRTYCFDPKTVEALNLLQPAQANVNGTKTNDRLRQKTFSTPFNLSKDLKKLNCKTLVLHGDRDIIPVAVAEHLHEYIEGSQLKVLKDCGHFPYVERPEEFFNEMNAFLK